MASSTWETAETAHLRYLVQQGKTAYDIWTQFQGEGIDRTQRAIERKIARERKRHPADWHARIAPAPYPKCREALAVQAHTALVLNDLHAPRHDAGFVNAAVDLALRWGADTVVLGGDVIDFDAFSFYGKALDTEAEVEIDAARQIVEALAASFAHVVAIAGNHEQRVARLLNHQLPVTRVMEWWCRQPNVRTSGYRWCTLESGGQRYYVEHPKNTSVIPTRVASKLCSKMLSHVIMGHNHLWGMTRDESGTFWAIESGVCADPERIPYYNEVHNTRPAMCTGAVIVRDGVPWLLSPENVKQL